MLIFPPFFFSLAIAAHEGKRVYWSGKVSSHFTGQVCAVFLSLNGNCSFHLAALPVGDYWEALLERDRGREGGGAGVRALVRAWQAADKSSSRCSCMHLPLLLELSISLCLPHTHTHMHIAFFSLHTCEALIITLAFWWVSLLSSGKDKSKTCCLYWVWNH